MAFQTDKDEVACVPAPAPLKQDDLASKAVTQSYSKEGIKQEREEEEEEEEEEEDEEDHFRHRRLTGDSGIEVCRCHIKREGEDEELQKGRGGNGVVKDGPEVLHDSVDCSLRAQAAVLSPLLDVCAEQHGQSSSPSSSGPVQNKAEAIITLE